MMTHVFSALKYKISALVSAKLLKRLYISIERAEIRYGVFIYLVAHYLKLKASILFVYLKL